MLKRLVISAALLTIALPAWALPSQMMIRTPKQFESILEQIEDAAIANGAAKKAVYGCTEKVTNFGEDNVLSAGRTIEIHPEALVKLLVKLAASGKDKSDIGNQLVSLLKASKL